MSISWIKKFDKYYLKQKKVQQSVYIIGIIRGLITVGRELNIQFYTLVLFDASCGLIRSGKAGWSSRTCSGNQKLIIKILRL